MGWLDRWKGEKKKTDDSYTAVIADAWKGEQKKTDDSYTAVIADALEESGVVKLTPKLRSQWDEVQILFSSSTAVACLGGVGLVSFAVGWKTGSVVRSASAWTRCLTDVSDISSSNIGATAPWLRGRVVSVSDGDTVRFLHVPTWFHSSRLKEKQKMSDVALPIRICTIDTPETAKFGKPGQPFGQEAKECLEEFALDQMVKIRLLQKDQYGRAVAELQKPRLFRFQQQYADQQLLKAGLAEVYQGSGAVYGHLGKEAYIAMEESAKKAKRGMWSQGDERESAAEYKARLKNEEK